MRFPWQKRRKAPEPPVVRPTYSQPITEFEMKRLEEQGRWVTIRIQLMPKGAWVNWKHNIPEDLRKETRDALVALILKLQGGS